LHPKYLKQEYKTTINAKVVVVS